MKYLELEWADGISDSLIDCGNSTAISAEEMTEFLVSQYGGKTIWKSRTGLSGKIIIPDRPYLLKNRCGYNGNYAYGIKDEFEFEAKYIFVPNRVKAPVVTIVRKEESEYDVMFSETVEYPFRYSYKVLYLKYWDISNNKENSIKINLYNPFHKRGINLWMFLAGKVTTNYNYEEVISMGGSVIKVNSTYYVMNRYGVVTHRLGETIPDGELGEGIYHYNGLFYLKNRYQNIYLTMRKEFQFGDSMVEGKIEDLMDPLDFFSKDIDSLVKSYKSECRKKAFETFVDSKADSTFIQEIKNIMKENQNLVLTKEYAERVTNCPNGVGHFVAKYKFGNEASFSEILSHSSIDEMLENYHFRKVIIARALSEMEGIN